MNDERNYEYIASYDELQAVLEQYLMNFKLTTHISPISPVLHKHAISHLMRACRILRHPRGNGLLIGFSGTGKRGVIKLACHINGFL